MRFHMEACFWTHVFTTQAGLFLWRRPKINPKLTYRGAYPMVPSLAHRNCAPTFPTVHLAQEYGDEKAQAGQRTKRANMTDRQQDA
jgi:hypothetical protein